jgi:hypothetical protein
MLATPLISDPWPKPKLSQTKSNPSPRRLVKEMGSTPSHPMAAKKAVAKANINI